MRCPKCHAEIEEGYLYCKNCGEEIRIVPDYDPQVEDMLSGSLKDVVKEAQQNASEKAAGVQSAARTERGEDRLQCRGIRFQKNRRDFQNSGKRQKTPFFGNGV